MSASGPEPRPGSSGSLFPLLCPLRVRGLRVPAGVLHSALSRHRAVPPRGPRKDRRAAGSQPTTANTAWLRLPFSTPGRFQPRRTGGPLLSGRKGYVNFLQRAGDHYRAQRGVFHSGRLPDKNWGQELQAYWERKHSPLFTLRFLAAPCKTLHRWGKTVTPLGTP